MHQPLRTAAVATVLSTALGSALLLPGVVHHATGHARATRPPAVEVLVKSEPKHLTRSRTGFRPGNTVFQVRNAGAGGGIQLVRLHAGYTFHHLQRDLGKIFSGDVKTVRRVDRSVEFYGGTAAYKGVDNAFGAYLRAGTYYLLNVDKGTHSRLLVQGARQARRLRRPEGRVDYGKGNVFDTDKTLPAHGWISQTNHADEPHFTSLVQIKRHTTRAQVRRYFKHGAQGTPRWLIHFSRDAMVLGPGHHMVWHADARRGEFVEACWWPSDEDGMPHALMGMWNITHLR
jgi:hypothetical protein